MGEADGGASGLLAWVRGPSRHDATAPSADCCVLPFLGAQKHPFFYYLAALLL